MSAEKAKKTVPYTVPIGPVHPALKEPVMFTFGMEGEVVRTVDFAPGQTHRGIEWMGMRRNPVQIVHLTDRVCGICGIVHSLSFARAVEQIAGIEVPERADYIRVILHELERIQSHLLWAGVAAHELGFDSLFYLAWRVREESMDLIENLTGNRVNYGIVQIGGVRTGYLGGAAPADREGTCLLRGTLRPDGNTLPRGQHDPHAVPGPWIPLQG